MYKIDDDGIWKDMNSCFLMSSMMSLGHGLFTQKRKVALLVCLFQCSGAWGMETGF